MMPDLKGLKQMQKGLQGLLQEATENMCSHPASADATLKVVLAGSRVLSAVEMRFCPQEKGFLLHPKDQQYAENQR